ncbi:antitoxin [Streptomyces sp. TRM64462]|uniref:FitA-like ribbon-helix-helix domain-containing protein n=1 Tax=Streptomyces sp. TRM64462 TaxID=2741726 RepID=UPI001585FF65|nr:antitoxin [Streptomyces sp. TRM64462]
MSALTIRDLPDDAFQALKARAAQAGQSLQAYVTDLLIQQTSRPTWAEITERLEVEATATLTTEDVLASIDEGRDGRRS